VKIRIKYVKIVQTTNSSILISKDFFNIIAESSLIGVAIFRKDKVIYSNDRISDMLGMSGKEIVGNGIEIISRNIHKDDLRQFSDFFSADNPVPQMKIRFRFRKKSGRLVWYESNMIKISRDNDEYVVSILTDITEQKNTSRNLLKTKASIKVLLKKPPKAFLTLSSPNLLT